MLTGHQASLPHAAVRDGGSPGGRVSPRARGQLGSLSLSLSLSVAAPATRGALQQAALQGALSTSIPPATQVPGLEAKSQLASLTALQPGGGGGVEPGGSQACARPWQVARRAPLGLSRPAHPWCRGATRRPVGWA